ncbi:MAG TPA: TetR/AcrR family transcriptional regulator [Stellaceae bacterium]|nr:TetR/AcrR family transcriptional regulator [Stellaceae bacterium]
MLAERIREQILEVATPLFLTQGYGATSIEAVAKGAHMSKRTLYSRFRDKAELFGAVVHRLVEQLRPPNANTEQFFEGASIEAILQRLARLILRAALSTSALALHRVIVAEATRFPELAAALNQEGTRREAIRRIAALLEAESVAGRLNLSKPEFAAEQFLHMLVAGPQRRALGLGEPMTESELDAWASDAVDLFLNGCRGTMAR